MRKTICFQLISLTHLSFSHIFLFYFLHIWFCTFIQFKQASRQAGKQVSEGVYRKSKKTSKREKWNLFLFIFFSGFFFCTLCEEKNVWKFHFKILLSTSFYNFFVTFNSKFFWNNSCSAFFLFFFYLFCSVLLFWTFSC
jgi:hypothetical protein